MFMNIMTTNYSMPTLHLKRTALTLFAALFLVIAGPGQREALAKSQSAIVAGGCFWCIESDFEGVKGVTGVISGYTGGTTFAPTYQQVSFGETGHYEAVKITFNPSVISYEKILDLYWRSVDPTDAGGQFCDRGHPYKTAIFYQNETQKKLATVSKAMLQEKNILGKRVVTPIKKAKKFWKAENYHQDYYKKNTIKYKFYRARCGRDKGVKRLWGKQAWAAK